MRTPHSCWPPRCSPAGSGHGHLLLSGGPSSGPVDAAGNLTATYPPRSTTTYRARYAGDDGYAAAVVQR